jgi:hypothetical protein
MDRRYWIVTCSASAPWLNDEGNGEWGSEWCGFEAERAAKK